MSLSAMMLRRAAWFACLCVVLLAPTAGAVPVSATAAPVSVATGDFDGDGLHDHAMVDRRDPSLIRVWLSRSNSVDMLHSRAPILQIATTDLDGDDRAELIVHDKSARVHVWTHRRAAFEAFRARRLASVALTRSGTGHVDDRMAASADALADTTLTSFALVLCAHPRGPDVAASALSRPRRYDRARTASPSDPAAPRPPPSHVISI